MIMYINEKNINHSFKKNNIKSKFRLINKILSH